MRRLTVIVALIAVGAAALVAMGAGETKRIYEVRAIFDNASFVVTGLDVKVAGVRVGSISDLAVTPDSRAAVVLDIEDPAFQDFRADAECKVRPASLIGEEYVECEPTQPRAPGAALPPPLKVIASGPGKGQRLLPVENTSASVDLDLIAEAMRRPQRERLAIILGELGVGLAGRGRDLNEVIRKANPALGETSKVLRLLARQNDVLADLARDSDRIMAPLARERRSVSGFIENAGDVAEATARRREALEASIQRFPRFLAELRPTMARLEDLATEMTPVVTDLGAQAPAINRLVRQMGPFSRAGIPALESLGDVAEPGIPALRASRPILQDLRRFGTQARPVAGTLKAILTSFERNEGVERLMDYLFFQATAINGFDSFGHFLRAQLIVNVCSQYSITPVSGCEAKFTQAGARSATANAAAQPLGEVARDTAAILGGADPSEVLSGDERRANRRATQRRLERLRKQALRKASAPAAPAPADDGGGFRQAEPLMDFLFGGDR